MSRSGAVTEPCRVLLLFALPSLASAEIRGRVIVDDGLPPATPIPLELRCGATKIVETTTDAEGQFEMTVNAEGDCIITATLPGYTSAAIRVDRLPLDPGIAGLALLREGKWQGYALSPTTLAVSQKALASFAEGVRTLRGGGQQNMAKAERLFARAAEEDSKFAEAFFQLSRLRMARNDLAGARAALRSSLVADPWLISPYHPLLMLELADEHWSAARALCDQWLRLAPHSPDPRFYRALSALKLDGLAAAREDLRAIETGPEARSFARVHYLRGRIFEREGRAAGALTEYRIYLAAEPDGPEADDARAKLAKGATP